MTPEIKTTLKSYLGQLEVLDDEDLAAEIRLLSGRFNTAISEARSRGLIVTPDIVEPPYDPRASQAEMLLTVSIRREL